MTDRPRIPYPDRPAAKAEPPKETGGAKRFARYTKGEDGLNKLERAYRDDLEARKQAGEIWDYLVHAMAFRVGPKCFYHPDMIVFLADGTVEAHEVKGGFMEDKALVKVRAFQSKFHMPLVLVRRKKKQWEFTRYEPTG